MQVAEGGRKYATKCPFTGKLHSTAAPPRCTSAAARVDQTAYHRLLLSFATGLRPSMCCPSCGARVHSDAFHKADRLVR